MLTPGPAWNSPVLFYPPENLRCRRKMEKWREQHPRTLSSSDSGRDHTLGLNLFYLHSFWSLCHNPDFFFEVDSGFAVQEPKNSSIHILVFISKKKRFFENIMSYSLTSNICSVQAFLMIHEFFCIYLNPDFRWDPDTEMCSHHSFASISWVLPPSSPLGIMFIEEAVSLSWILLVMFS